MWYRKRCAICRIDFAVHPKAKTYGTRQLCFPCRSNHYRLEDGYPPMVRKTYVQ